jgi:hypothetical protein
VKKKLKRVVSQSRSSSKFIPKWHAAPLKGSFMVLAMLGFFVSAYLIYPRSVNYGITFMIVFVLMFVASLISMTKAPVVE